jgi:AraC-like DNA-binding protein
MNYANSALRASASSSYVASERDPGDRGQVSTVLVRALVDVVQQRGVSPQDLLGTLTESVYSEPVDRSLPRAVFHGLLSHAIELTGDPALGLHCGLEASQASFGLMTPLVGHAPNLRRGLDLIVQFHPLLIDGCRIQLTEQLGVARLLCEVPALGACDRSFVELMIAGLVRMLQAFGCAASEMRAVCFEHARPAYYHAYSAAFGGKERFTETFTGVEFAASALDRPHLHGLAELHAIVLSQAEQNLQRCSRPLTLTERVHALMHSRSASELPSMVSAARALGVSVRSLRRHLDEEGTTYRELTQSRLHALACILLRNPQKNLQSIAYELGFSDATAFHRAFKRWAKVTPAEFRNEFLGAERH